MQQPQRSSLITTIAWCVIISFTLMAFVAFLLSLIFFFLVPAEEIQGVVGQARALHVLPEWGIQTILNFHWIAFWVFVFSAFMMAAGMALLKRREWSRKTTVIILGLSILVFLPSLFFRYDPSQSPLPMPEEMKASLAQMANALFVMNLFFCLVHGWLIWKLQTPAVKAEFLAGGSIARAPKKTSSPSA